MDAADVHTCGESGAGGGVPPAEAASPVHVQGSSRWQTRCWQPHSLPPLNGLAASVSGDGGL